MATPIPGDPRRRYLPTRLDESGAVTVLNRTLTETVDQVTSVESTVQNWMAAEAAARLSKEAPKGLGALPIRPLPRPISIGTEITIVGGGRREHLIVSQDAAAGDRLLYVEEGLSHAYAEGVFIFYKSGAALNALDERLTSLLDQIQEIRDENVRWYSRFNNSVRELESLKGRVTQLQDDMEGYVESLQSVIRQTAEEILLKVTRSLSRYDTLLEWAEAQFIMTAEQISMLVSNYRLVDERLLQMVARLDLYGDRIDALTLRVDITEAELHQQYSRLTIASDEIAALVSRIDAVVDGLYSTMAQLVVTAESITSTVSAAQFSALSGGVEFSGLAADFDSSTDTSIFIHGTPYPLYAGDVISIWDNDTSKLFWDRRVAFVTVAADVPRPDPPTTTVEVSVTWDPEDMPDAFYALSGAPVYLRRSLFESIHTQTAFEISSKIMSTHRTDLVAILDGEHSGELSSVTVVATHVDLYHGDVLRLYDDATEDYVEITVELVPVNPGGQVLVYEPLAAGATSIPIATKTFEHTMPDGAAVFTKITNSWSLVRQSSLDILLRVQSETLFEDPLATQIRLKPEYITISGLTYFEPGFGRGRTYRAASPPAWDEDDPFAEADVWYDTDFSDTPYVFDPNFTTDNPPFSYQVLDGATPVGSWRMAMTTIDGNRVTTGILSANNGSTLFDLDDGTLEIFDIQTTPQRRVLLGKLDGTVADTRYGMQLWDETGTLVFDTGMAGTAGYLQNLTLKNLTVNGVLSLGSLGLLRARKTEDVEPNPLTWDLLYDLDGIRIEKWDPLVGPATTKVFELNTLTGELTFALGVNDTLAGSNWIQWGWLGDSARAFIGAWSETVNSNLKTVVGIAMSPATNPALPLNERSHVYIANELRVGAQGLVVNDYRLPLAKGSPLQLMRLDAGGTDMEWVTLGSVGDDRYVRRDINDTLDEGVSTTWIAGDSSKSIVAPAAISVINAAGTQTSDFSPEQLGSNQAFTIQTTANNANLNITAHGTGWIQTTPVRPQTNGTYDLGHSSYRWQAIYAIDLNLTDDIAAAGGLFGSGGTGDTDASVTIDSGSGASGVAGLYLQRNSVAGGAFYYGADGLRIRLYDQNLRITDNGDALIMTVIEADKSVSFAGAVSVVSLTVGGTAVSLVGHTHSLTTDVTGVLPLANGGTGSSGLSNPGSDSFVGIGSGGTQMTVWSLGSNLSRSGAVVNLAASVAITTGLTVGGNSVLTTASTIDADTLDTYHATAFPRKAENATLTGSWKWYPGATGLQTDSATLSLLGNVYDAAGPTDYEVGFRLSVDAIGYASGDPDFHAKLEAVVDGAAASSLIFDSDPAGSPRWEFSSPLYVSGTLVSLAGHTHTAANITDFATAVATNANVVANTSHRLLTSNPHSVTKAQVGLGNVENTALSTWAGSTSITTIGTLTTGTVPWARLSGVPTYDNYQYWRVTVDGGTNSTVTATNGVMFAGGTGITTSLAAGTVTISWTGGAHTHVAADITDLSTAIDARLDTTQSISSQWTFTNHIALNATKGLYLDGGSDTFIAETSANLVGITTGGTAVFTTSTTATNVGYASATQYTLQMVAGNSNYAALNLTNAGALALVAGNASSGSTTLTFSTAASGAETQALKIASDQKLWIGSTEDTNLYRSAANTLKTDDNFVVGGTLTVSGGGTSSFNSHVNFLNTNTIAFQQTTGYSPFTVVSTTVVTNLNADMLDGLHASSFLTSSSNLTALNDVSGTPSAYDTLVYTGSGWVDAAPAWHNLLSKYSSTSSSVSTETYTNGVDFFSAGTVGSRTVPNGAMAAGTAIRIHAWGRVTTAGTYGEDGRLTLAFREVGGTRREFFTLAGPTTDGLTTAAWWLDVWVVMTSTAAARVAGRFWVNGAESAVTPANITSQAETLLSATYDTDIELWGWFLDEVPGNVGTWYCDGGTIDITRYDPSA